METCFSSAREALDRLMRCYLVERNIEKTLDCVTDDIYSVGTGALEVGLGREAFRALLEKEISEDSAPFSYTFTRLEGKSAASGCVVFYADVLVRKENAGQDGILMATRLTVEFREEGGRFLACVLHMSVAAGAQEEQEFFPFRFGERTISELKQKFKEESFALMNRSVPGGMMGGYIEEGFPLYFVNDTMLEYLGYTYDEFVKAIGGYVRNCMHPDDRGMVTSAVTESLARSGEYEVTYRMLKKDGSFIWVFDKGRKTLSEDDRPVIISVCTDITQYIELQQALMDKNRELEHFYNTIYSGISKIADDDDYTFLYGNDSYYRMLGFSKEEYDIIDAGDPSFFLHLGDREVLGLLLLSTGRTGHPFSQKVRLRKKDGTYLWVRMDGSLSDELYEGNRVFYCMYTDIDAQREQEMALRKQQHFNELVLTSNTVGMVIVYPERGYPFAYVGDNLIAFLGYSKPEFFSRFKVYTDICCPEDIPAIKEEVDAQLANSNYYEVEYRVVKKKGGPAWVLEKGTRTADEDGREILVCILLDYSRQKTENDRLLRESTLDPLTGICNRRAARVEVETYLTGGQRADYSALLLLDLDNFKQINDLYGHMEGDTVLVEVANLLSNSLRNTDVVARLGGDEFICFIKSAESLSEIAGKAAYICELMEKKFSKHFEKANLTASIGIVSISKDESPVFEQLYRAADIALYQAKCDGKNTYRLYEPDK